jgi:hypothetical protein
MEGARALPQPKECVVKKWFRENLDLLMLGSSLVNFVGKGIVSFHEWLADDPQYVKDGAFALFWLGLGLFYLWRWRQQQLRM